MFRTGTQDVSHGAAGGRTPHAGRPAAYVRSHEDGAPIPRMTRAKSGGPAEATGPSDLARGGMTLPPLGHCTGYAGIYALALRPLSPSPG